ncbi:MAG: AI-2E family transporter [Alphaproteobacteria bacterium]|nr:AI-2E family transporter [Alphaproteobacteria bacterium]
MKPKPGSLALPLIVLAVAAGLAFAWYYASSLLLLFAGILFAAFLDAGTHGLGRIAPLSRPWRYALVVLTFMSVAGFAIGLGLVRLPAQAALLMQVMNAQLDVLERQLAAFGIDLFGPNGRQDLSQFITDPGRLFGHVQYAVSGAYVVIMNTVVIVCLGLFFAAHPGAYRDGALRLVPIAARPRVREVVDEMGSILRSWLLSQLARSVVVTVVLWLVLQVLGVPGAPLLGLQAGIANFVPYLGPLIAAFPIALAAMPLGLSSLAWVMAIYFCIQTIEGFVVAPLIQKEVVDVPPAWTLFAIVLLGAMFGILGVALAAPLLALGRVALLRFYIEDWLHDRATG